ncbi:MAG: 6-pyruvoyl trahydropterin synthase family protein [Bacteroidia bacterium]
MLKEHENIRVTKKFTFDMAHALYGHDGPCRNIHGHTYHLSVTIIGKPMVKLKDPKDGMVIDFSELKRLVKKEVIERFDHALVLNGKSPHKKLLALTKQFEKIILLPFQPTCENLLLEIKNSLKKKLNNKYTLWIVRLDETTGSYAEWYLSDNC